MSENGERNEPVASSSGPQPGAAESPATQKTIRAGAWAVTGAVFSWKMAKRMAGAALRWLTAKPAPDGSQPPPESGWEAPAEATGRDADRNLTLEQEKKLFARRQWGTLFVSCALACCFSAGVGFLFMYWTGGNNELLGGTLALFFAGLGSAMVLWAHWLTVHKEATDEREDMSPPPEEKQAAIDDFCAGRREIHRRGLLKWAIGGAIGIVAVMTASIFRSLGFNPGNALYTAVWKRGQRLMTPDGQPVKADTLPPGGTVIVYPEDSIGSEKAQTVLVRVDAQLLQLPSDRADWAPMGNLAFSRVCTHAGCSVGLYLATAHLLMCPCHQSTFDVLRAAQPTGGPAARPLPQLPIYADSEGVLRAGGGFTEPPGPGFWGMP